MRKTTLKKAFKDSLPVLAGYTALGIGFGVMLQSKGYSFWWAAFMSITMFSGSAQYAAVDLLSNSATILTTVLMTLVINARYFFYGFSLLGKYNGIGKAKPYLIFGLTDETYSLVCSFKPQDGVDEKKYCLYLTLLNHSYWIMGSTIGALLGTFITFNSKGIDFAMTALFVVIFIEQWLDKKEHISAIIGVVTTLVCLFIFGAEYFIIPSMILISAELIVFRKVIERKENSKQNHIEEASDNG